MTKRIPRGRTQSAATMQDIGRELGLSAMTISRALNGHPDVKEETRNKVLAWAAQRNYRPNRWARSLVTKRSQLIGIVIPDISHSFFSEITRGVQDVIEAQGYDLILCHTHGDAARERSVIDSLVGNHVDGLVVASEQLEADTSLFESLNSEGVPFVLVDRIFPSMAALQVRADDFAVGRMATEYLIELGHTRIGHISGKEISPSRLRQEGYCSAMAAQRLPVEPGWVVASDYTYDGGAAAMRQLLALPERPTAVFAGNDPAGMGAIQACREAGLSVPQDVSIVGAGCIEGINHPCPFLTTLDWSRREIGETAARLLLSSLTNEEAPEPSEAVYPPRLLVRQSTGPAAIECRTASVLHDHH